MAVGKPVPVVDARAKVSGRTQYTVDLHRPGMLYGKILRSPHHHARVVSIDTSAALHIPGVKAVVTGFDLPRVRYGFGWRHRQDMYALSWDKARFKGDEIAAVAAVDESTAAEALQAIVVEYEPLPPVFDFDAALAGDAPLLHDDAPGNIAGTLAFSKGDVDAAFAEPDVVVVEGTYETQRVHQCYMEPMGCLAEWSPDGRLTMYIGSMNTSGIRWMLANSLELPISRVRVVQPNVGGSFGSKVTNAGLYPATAWLAKVTGRPVRTVYTREEEYFAGRPRVNNRIWLKTAARRDGSLLAREVKLLNDVGAYVEMAAAMLEVMSHRSDSLYRIPNIRFDGRMVYTNKSPIGAYRGFGNPQMTFAYEEQLDRIARELDMDPLELRLKNASRQGDVSVHGWELKSCGYPQALEIVRERSGWVQKRAERRPFRGLGVAGTIHEGDDRHSTGFAGSEATLEIFEDGRVSITSGEGEFGQGAHTTFAQIAAEVLTVPLEDVSVRFPDTDISAYALGPWGSRITISGGNAVRYAAEAARNQLLEEAAVMWDVRTENLGIAEGRVFVEGDPERSSTVAEVAKAALYRLNGGVIRTVGKEEPSTSMMNPEIQSNPCSAYSFAAQVAEVTVDPDTGRVTIEGIWTANDCGRVLNPLMADAQVEASVLQGIGFTLSEHMEYRRGHLREAGFLGTGTPNVYDMPPVEVRYTDTHDPYGPYGAKGVAELGQPPIPAALAGAIEDAIGVRFTRLPITPEDIVRALQKKEDQA
ncbi:MAG: xanthine dehydrogenase family protein molybdopterin-binding subunit [Thermoleophilia bacterium]|nr:xanthine dehydrogenase family protein molybdopterin-binding subunit [Thermoleophilia bacterium]